MTSCTMCLWNWYCAAVSPSDRNSLTSKKTQMQNVQVHKYKNTHCICGLGGVPLRLPVTGTHYPAPPTTISNSFPLSLILNAHQATYWVLTDNPASPTAITIASYANALRPSKVLIWFKFDNLAKLGWFKPWERLFYTFGNFCKFHQRIHIFQIHFWNI